MKITKPAPLLLLSAIIICFALYSFMQKGEPWTDRQLMPPATLAKIITDGKEHPYIFSIGPSATIQGSVDIGPAQDKQNLSKLKQQLAKLPKNADIIIYCGCCPFVHCPNIRPAFALLNEMKFTNAKLLSLQKNIRANWIDKGYPVIK
jgi:thiosulfate/3-mercaptopyruvate sulfurtransferase